MQAHAGWAVLNCFNGGACCESGNWTIDENTQMSGDNIPNLDPSSPVKSVIMSVGGGCWGDGNSYIVYPGGSIGRNTGCPINTVPISAGSLNLLYMDGAYRTSSAIAFTNNWNHWDGWWGVWPSTLCVSPSDSLKTQ
jgi:hypothetical protein